jgi:hypothetical protein
MIRRQNKNKYEAPYDTYIIWQLTPYLGTESIDHGGECSMQTSTGLREAAQLSQSSPIVTQRSLSGVPEALPCYTRILLV